VPVVTQVPSISISMIILEAVLSMDQCVVVGIHSAKEPQAIKARASRTWSGSVILVWRCGSGKYWRREYVYVFPGGEGFIIYYIQLVATSLRR
jgi:hypothetical protein